MNQAWLSKRASLRWPLIESINCRATQSLPLCPDSSTSQERNGPDGTGDPAFRVEHAPDQEFDEGTTGARGYRRQKEGNPFREQQTNRCGERHEGASERENSSLVAALLALKSTPGEQRSDLRNGTSYQVFFASL